MRKSLSLLAIAVVSLAFAPAPFSRPARRDNNESDLKKMQGKWVRIRNTVDGAEWGGGTPVTITGNRMQFPSPDDAWTITLDVAKSSRWIDLVQVNQPQSNFRGVYRVQGNMLTICWRHNVTPANRPTSFAPKQSGVWYQVFERRKP
jgi:uncharacterized protein (TIGR03067 family)